MSKEKVLLFGGSGMVGSVFQRLLSDEFAIVAPARDQVNVTKAPQIRQAIEMVGPNFIVNSAALADVDGCEKDARRAYRVNSYAPGVIAWEAGAMRVPVCQISTDYIFDGKKDYQPYTEADEPNPISVYGRSKRLGEERVLNASPNNLVVRIIMPYCTSFERKGDIVRTPLKLFQKGSPISGVVDQKINPIACSDLVAFLALLIKTRQSGVWHAGALDFTTPADLFQRVARQFGFSDSLVSPVTFSEFSRSRVAPRPQNSWLDCSKFVNRFGKGVLHTIDQSLELFARELKKAE